MSDPYSPAADLTAPTVRIEPMGWLAPAPSDLSILQAALRAGIELPNACRNGTCRSCLSRLLSGEIRYLIEWPGVSLEEKREGLFLPCVACAQTDIVIEQPLASRSSKLNVT